MFFGWSWFKCSIWQEERFLLFMIYSLQIFIHGCKDSQNIRTVCVWVNLLTSVLDFYLRTPMEETDINLLVLKFNRYFKDFLLIKMLLLPKKKISSRLSLSFHFFQFLTKYFLSVKLFWLRWGDPSEHRHTTACMWGSDDNLQESALSFQYGGPGVWTEVPPW